MAKLSCPICRTELTNPPIISTVSTDRVVWKPYDCPVCGPFSINPVLAVHLQQVASDYRLSAWIREHKEFEREPPQITGTLLEDVIKNFRKYSVSEKQLLLLRAIERRTEYPGSAATIAEEDYPLAWAKNCAELHFLLSTVIDRKMIESQNVARHVETTILPDGWDYLDKHSISPAFQDRAFIAMSFDKSLDPIYENGIKTAIEKAGYKPHRIDKEPHIDRIDAKIIADIKDSLFMVADVTQQKQGVYFEAGYALALKRPVIWCVGEDDLKKVHFDTRQFYHIVWKTPEDLHERLYDMICAVIGKRGQEEK